MMSNFSQTNIYNNNSAKSDKNCTFCGAGDSPLTATIHVCEQCLNICADIMKISIGPHSVDSLVFRNRGVDEMTIAAFLESHNSDGNISMGAMFDLYRTASFKAAEISFSEELEEIGKRSRAIKPELSDVGRKYNDLKCEVAQIDARQKELQKKLEIVKGLAAIQNVPASESDPAAP